jgi:3-hydroxyisobutyrate dehydrogenase-like beta-hydroxyacid dehydrogenase
MSSSNKPSMGVIGLGIMGGAMAEALLKDGYRVCGYDPSPQARARLKKAGGRPLASSTAVADSAEIIITSLATVAALEQVGEQIAASKKWPKGNPRRIVIETSTLPIPDKERAQKAWARAGITTLDCPISGTAVRMPERTWNIYVSGPRTAVKRAMPVLKVFSDTLPYVGVFGNGTKFKFAANHLVAIYNVAYGESVTFARKMGLDATQLYELFAPSGVLGTGVMRLRMNFMAKRQYSPPTMKVEVWQKDMQVIGDMAKSVDCPTPLFTACVPIYNAAMAQGLAAEDTASVAEVIGGMAGLPGKAAGANKVVKTSARKARAAAR